MLYFLVVNYYSTQFIKSLIKSIRANVETSFRIIIINNSENDRDIDNLEDDWVSVFNSGDNIGFGAACNLGIQHIKRLDPAALIWLINPDTAIHPQADQFLLRCLYRNPELAILGTQIVDSSGNKWFGYGGFNKWTGYVGHKLSKYVALDTDENLTATDWVSGCSMVINLAQFKEMPRFDTDYFLYLEDVDFCIRYAKKGYKIAVVNREIVTHQISAITGKNSRFLFHHYTYGRLLCLSKHATTLGFLIYCTYLLVKIPILFLTSPRNATGRCQGFWDFIHNKQPGKPLPRSAR
ncbi:MAG: glycosyltransferase [Leptolyngbyaceae cyanobacterium]